MKSPKRPRSRTSKLALTATLMTVPMLGVPASATAQKAPKKERPSETTAEQTTRKTFVLPHVLEKSGAAFTLAGAENGRTILKDEAGKLFYLDPKTGDQKFLAQGYTIKHSTDRVFIKVKHSEYLTLHGVDAEGNTVMENSKKQKFYLEPSTGDMVFVK